MSIGTQPKMKLNIPQLTLAKLTEIGRHQSPRNSGSVPTGGKLFAEIILFFPT